MNCLHSLADLCITLRLTGLGIFGITSLDMDYKHTLIEAQKKLNELVAQRDLIDREIEALSRIVEGARIATQPPSHWDPDNPAWVPKTPPEPEPAGFTDSVRLILQRSGTPLLPTEIRGALETLGIEGTSPKNLLIHVHKVLSRLYRSGEVEQVPHDGRTGYTWVSPIQRSLREMNQSNGAIVATRAEEKKK